MPYSELLYSVGEAVATVTLNRPDRLNAWTWTMEQEFMDALRSASSDPAVRAIVLTGAGRGFCAGADMSLLESLTAQGRPEGGHQHPVVDFPGSRKQRYSWLLNIEKPLIAAINGPAVGLGFIIPLYCDIRLASSSAKFSTIFAKRGLIAEYGLAWLLPHITGLGAALELLITGRTFNAEEALRLGLVHQVIPEAGFAAQAQDYAAAIAASVSPRSVAVMKRQLYAALEEPLDAAISRAFGEMLSSLKSEDFKEGVSHFLEKRPAKFTGR
jgi:enoyl-CoA hydratase/carnithine racemase